MASDPRPEDVPLLSALEVLLGDPSLAARELRRCRDLSVRPVLPDDYPPALSHVPRPPELLYLQGRLEPCTAPTVAVVGSRRASPLGLRQAYRLGRELAERGLTVVSGLARGIDAAALEGALAGGGRPGAVLGNGLPRIYPAENRDLADRMVSAGGFVASEFPLDSPPRRHHFPRRNRLIAGLGAALVVVEAALASGSLISVGWALELGREVLAFPGPAEGPHYEGCHALIRDGAGLVTGADQVVEALAGSGSGVLEKELQTWEERVAAAIRDGANTPEAVLRATGLPAPRVLQGWVRCGLGGGPNGMS